MDAMGRQRTEQRDALERFNTRVEDGVTVVRGILRCTDDYSAALRPGFLMPPDEMRKR